MFTSSVNDMRIQIIFVILQSYTFVRVTSVNPSVAEKEASSCVSVTTKRFSGKHNTGNNTILLFSLAWGTVLTPQLQHG